MPPFTQVITRIRPALVNSYTRARTFHAAAASSAPYKDSQDKDSLSPRSSEHVKSAKDDDIARLDKTAYKPSDASPETARSRANDESARDDDPLEFSGANQELSKPRGDERSNLDRAPGKDARGAGLSTGGKASRKGEK
ncbi:hypothetical protein NQ176_g2956 [Zarea fungicola]|uniref:Uncharacterized protein n=1 Tax=Zarea fungicola TaxID=93591 RepID=A0ACC1NLY7_9HYPO|nr:hypothetical protein NQ176_g2956 [Lecanicillium fungicola]